MLSRRESGAMSKVQRKSTNILNQDSIENFEKINFFAKN